MIVRDVDGFSRAGQFWYWILPSAVVGSYIALYFSGYPALQSFVAPHINRELGILEGTQHLILLVLVILNVRRAAAQEHAMARAMWWTISAGTLFMLLEELDYGQHYIEFLRGLPLEQRSTLRSFHDGANTQRLKAVAAVIDIGFFLLLPLFAGRWNHVWVRYFAPPRLAITTIIAGFVLAKFAHGLDHAGFGAGGALYSGIAEFKEAFTYWLWFLYFDVLASRPWPGR